MQLLGPDSVQNTVSKSPWLFESTDQAKGGGKKKKRTKAKSKANRRKSVKNKTRRRIYN
jgi:hypothetical protein